MILHHNQSGMKVARYSSLAGRSVEHSSMYQQVAGSIPSLGTCPGCELEPHLGVCRKQMIEVSLSPSPSLPLSLNQ